MFSLESQYYFTTYEEVHSINSKKQLKGRKKKKSVIILAASVLAAVGSHKKERKNIYEYKLRKYGRSERRLKYKH